jgi:(p)ppGpp synthase/HD superfamily hydrolase
VKTEHQIILRAAVSIAHEAHRFQVRKGSGLPYIVHPMEVLKRVHDLGVTDIVTLAAAVLHDTLEDASSDPERQRIKDGLALFPPAINGAILRIVEELTYYPSKGPKSVYIESFATASPEALVIKIVDRAVNIMDFDLAGDDYAEEYAGKGAILFQIAIGHDKPYGKVADDIRAKFGSFVMSRLQALAKQAWLNYPFPEPASL